MPLASVRTLRFVPCLPRSVGLRPLVFPPERRLRHRAVGGQPLQSIPLGMSYSVSPRRRSSRNTPAAHHS